TLINTDKLTWSVDANLTLAGNEVISLVEGQTEILPDNYTTIRIGESIRAIYGYDYVGVNKANGYPIYRKSDGNLVQGNIPMDISGADAYRDAFRRQTQASRALVAKGASWIVWSESAFLYPVPESDAERFLADGLTRSLGRPAILGALVYRNEGGGDRTFNSALVTDSQGRLRGRYDKHHLLAFGEYLPFGETFPILYRLSPASGRITPGDGFSPLDIDGHRVAVLICYEDILPGFVREAVQATSPELLVDVTNDAWFGPTAEPELHLALARLRAIEHRTFLVRAANTGVTSVVDPAGRVVARAPLFESASLLAEVRWFKSPTVFERVGGFPWWFAAGVAFGLAWLPRSKLRSGRRGHRLASPRS
ncbi:MAG TPA: apolipoprotein N-acyltransferase, partial [Polyangiaceae bacterium]|nr:apolipoprotein N-acyltransferase [Polyangiaceae bacterium]